MSYTVTAPLVLARDQEGAVHHYYEGAAISWLSDEQREHFQALGLISSGTGPDEPEGGDEAPTKAAPKGDWVDYAEAEGYDRDEVEAMTKAEIQALFD